MVGRAELAKITPSVVLDPKPVKNSRNSRLKHDDLAFELEKSPSQWRRPPSPRTFGLTRSREKRLVKRYSAPMASLMACLRPVVRIRYHSETVAVTLMTGVARRIEVTCLCAPREARCGYADLAFNSLEDCGWLREYLVTIDRGITELIFACRWAPEVSR
jgi:hypothetical protein